jgi:peptidyl-prolyl cis-trans isomerase SurA
MTAVVRVSFIALVGLVVVSCGSKAKESQQVQDKLAKWEKEHQAQAAKQASPAPQPSAERSASQRADGIAARVNEEVLFLSDLDLAGKELFQKIRSQTPADQADKEMVAARRMVLEKLIEKALLEQEAQKRRVRVTDEEVEASVNRFVSQRGGTKEQLYAELAREKIPPERFREKLRKEVMVHRLLELMIASHIHVSDQQCQEYYEKNKGSFSGATATASSGGARIQQIILVTRGLKAEDKASRLRQLEEIRSKILRGDDFGKMARQFSQGPNPEGGGDCGYFQPGELLGELDRVAFSLDVGTVSEVIETPVGFHLVRVTDKGGSGSKTTRDFESVKESIKAKVAESMYEQEYQKLLDSLRKSAYIDVRM